MKCKFIQFRQEKLWYHSKCIWMRLSKLVWMYSQVFQNTQSWFWCLSAQNCHYHKHRPVRTWWSGYHHRLLTAWPAHNLGWLQFSWPNLCDKQISAHLWWNNAWNKVKPKEPKLCVKEEMWLHRCRILKRREKSQLPIREIDICFVSGMLKDFNRGAN